MTISYLHIIAGEQAAKWIGILKPLPTLLWIATPLRLFYFLTYPFTWILNESVLKLLKLIGFGNVLHQERTYSVEELRLLFASAVRNTGDRLSLGHEIVLNAIDLRNRIVRDVMRPRKEIVFLSTDMKIDKCIEIAETTRYSRFPLVENGDIDKTIGVIHIKDLYQLKKTAKYGRDLIPVVKKLIYVPPTARLEKLLNLFLERRLHMAIVVDEFGGTIGLITLENTIEEIVGQIQDEFDQEKQTINKIGENCWEILGTTPLYELSEIVKQPLNVEGISTISGWVTHYLGGFPKTGDIITLGDFKLMVQSMNGALVDKIKLWKEKPKSENSPDNNNNTGHSTFSLKYCCGYI
jgi:CBS domain containing-hemolysin-like protein